MVIDIHADIQSAHQGTSNNDFVCYNHNKVTVKAMLLMYYLCGAGVCGLNQNNKFSAISPMPI